MILSAVAILVSDKLLMRFEISCFCSYVTYGVFSFLAGFEAAFFSALAGAAVFLVSLRTGLDPFVAFLLDTGGDFFFCEINSTCLDIAAICCCNFKS